jgi:hypothetical protein
MWAVIAIILLVLLILQNVVRKVRIPATPSRWYRLVLTSKAWRGAHWGSNIYGEPVFREGPTCVCCNAEHREGATRCASCGAMFLEGSRWEWYEVVFQNGVMTNAPGGPIKRQDSLDAALCTLQDWTSYDVLQATEVVISLAGKSARGLLRIHGSDMQMRGDGNRWDFSPDGQTWYSNLQTALAQRK